jgi:phospholipase/lecithinase/hemolysin
MLLSGLAGWISFPAHGGFSSIHIFGDGASSTTNNETGGRSYYGKRFCDGRVWVEVLAQRQGIPFYNSNNWSYYGYESGFVATNLTNLARFTPPSDAATALWVVWAADADYVDFLTGMTSTISTNRTAWTDAGNRFLTNHLTIIQRLYAKGARTLVMPPAVDIMSIPFFNHTEAPIRTFVRQQIIEFNAGLSNVILRAKAASPGLVIYSPDFFTLLDKIVTQPILYGFTNATTGAQDVFIDSPTNGPGTNFVFWDYMNPSAKAHLHMADLAQQLLSPAQIGSLTRTNSTNWLTLTNVPIGRNGIVEGTSNFTTWTAVTNFSSTNLVQTVRFPATNSFRFYRLRYPFAWSWP